jgi:hypothetical protein
MADFVVEVLRVITSPVVEKGLFSKPYITFRHYLGCYEQIFEIGAALGFVHRNRFTTVVRLLSVSGREQDLAPHLNQVAQKVLAETGRPSSFLDLAMLREEPRIENLWREAGASEAQIQSRKESFRLELNGAFQMLQAALTYGIAFGGTFPDLTEELWRAAYEGPVDENEWRGMRQAGLSLPEKPPGPVSIEEMYSRLLPLIRSCVAAECPELLPQFQEPC